VKEAGVSVVTLDVMMPRVDGWEAAARLRSDPETAHIKVVLLSARAQEADLQRGEKIGVDAYLTKPFDPDELIEVVRRLAAEAEDASA
jgi:CheY-like chemotaxis protein